MKQLCVVMISACVMGSCNKRVIYDKDDAPVVGGQPRPQAAGDTIQASFKILAARPESWSKNCLTLSLAGDPSSKQSLGCNKTLALGAEATLDLAKEGCNEIKIEFSVFQNKGKCEATTSICEGTYNQTPDWVRASDTVSGIKFLRVVNAAAMFPLLDIQLRVPGKSDADIKAEYQATEKEAQEFVATPGNTWVRVFFEDQNDKNFMQWQSQKTDWQKLGVDFNDMVFDLKASNVKFKIMGSSLDTCK